MQNKTLVLMFCIQLMRKRQSFSWCNFRLIIVYILRADYFYLVHSFELKKLVN